MGDVLVLNRNFYAIAVTGWQRAISLLYLDHARVVDEGYRTYDFVDWLDASRDLETDAPGFINTPNLRIAIPEVISLRLFGKVPKREVTFSRRNLLHHYGWRCAYCGEKFTGEKLNLDHVLPKSRGGETNWANVVVSCIPCNKRKGNRLPSEAGMKLVRTPGKPRARSGPILWPQLSDSRRSWQRFLSPSAYQA
jgi:5-methylcytosine-specific restriction endonuclease McrA